MALAESALGAASKVGRYFTVISVLPATLFALISYALLSTQPWTGRPHWDRALKALTDVGLSGLIAGAILVLLLAFVLHPLQFAMVQLLEGYWGPSKLATQLAANRIRYHRARAQTLELLSIQSYVEVHKQPQEPGQPVHEDVLRHWWAQQEADRARDNYPLYWDDIMPTALGNVLRRYEERAGRPYGLSILAVAPHLALLAPREHVGFLQDQRTQLDLATRLCVTAALLAVEFTAVLAVTGWWLLIAAIPYVFSLAFYRGACTVAHDYGTALQALIDLDRTALYEQLRIPLPPDAATERDSNRVLESILANRSVDDLTYERSLSAIKSACRGLFGGK